MPLNIYDSAKHHIAFRQAVGLDKIGLLLEGAYTRELQLEGQPEAEFGGDSDLIGRVPGRSRWTQDDLVGGAFQGTWGADDAMFSSCIGFIPSGQSNSVITVPPMVPKELFNPAGQADAPAQPILPVAMITVAGSIYTAFRHGILRYQIDTDTFTWGPTVASSTTFIRDFQYDQAEGSFYALVDYTTAPNSATALVRVNPDLTLPVATQIYLSPLAAPIDGRGFEVLNSNYVVGIGQQLYIFTPAESASTSGAAATVQGVDGIGIFALAGNDATVSKWTKIGRLPGRWIRSVAYNGLVYILCGSTDNQTHLVATDGSNIFPITSLPYSFQGRSLASYGGRLYIGGQGSDLSGGERCAELHEVSGSSTRMIRSFNSDTVVDMPSPAPTTITDLCVADGLLWMFLHGSPKLWAYDITTDGIFGASEFRSGTAGAQVYRMTVGREKLWGWGHHDTDANQDGLYRIAVAGDAIAAYDCELTTSDFTHEIARTKRWSEIRVMTRTAGCAIEASVDGGNSFVNVPISSTSVEGSFVYTTGNLTGFGATNQLRLRFVFNNGTVQPPRELIAFTVSYVYTDTGKNVWSMRVIASDSVEGVDGTTIAQDVAATIAQIRTWSEEKRPLAFFDLNGQEYTATIVACREHRPLIGAPLAPSANPVREAFLDITVAEV